MKKILALLLAGAMCLGLAACNSNSQPVPSEADKPAESQSADDTQQSAEPKELSGKVTVYMPSPAGLADKLAAGFTAATDVEVEQFQGTTSEILARLEAEEANPVADVVILASWSDGLSMKQDGKLMSYTPANADKVVDGDRQRFHPVWVQRLRCGRHLQHLRHSRAVRRLV